MTRLIPGKTKVEIELFRGVTLGDVLVAGIALALVILAAISNLPGKVYVIVGVLLLNAGLLVRIDGCPNYSYLLHIFRFLGYDRHFARLFSDEMLLRRGAGEAGDAAFDALFGKRLEPAPERRAARRAEARAQKRARQETEKLEESIGRTVAKEKTKERENQRKAEEKLLRDKSVPEEEKEAIRARRAARGEQAMRERAAAKDANTSRKNMEQLVGFTDIRDGYIEYLHGSYYGAALAIEPVEFRFFSEHRRKNSIENCLGRILRSVHAGYSANIVKLERPILYDGYLDREYDNLDALRRSYENGVLSEDELRARAEIEYDRINELRRYDGERQVIEPAYYLVLFESDKRQLEAQIREAAGLLKNGELTVRRLDDRELAVFLKYTNQIDFDERDIDRIEPEDYAQWAQPEQVDLYPRRVEVNHIVTHNFRVVSYPTLVGDAWLAGVMSLPGTKVVVKARPMDRQKAIRSIDRSLQELRGQWSATGVDSRRMEIETHIQTLGELLSTLQSDSESLLECGIYITAYDITATRNDPRIVQPPRSNLPTINEMKKNVRRTWQEQGFRLNGMEFDQMQAFIGAQVSALDPVPKQARGISSNTVAACFPWIFAHISDEGGVKLGESDAVPVFIDFFRRDAERVNSNMVIVGKSGSGKSYATKSILANLAADNSKIFILDPENEYAELAKNLRGQMINVGNAQHGRLNPFHIITALDDDEADEGAVGGSYATHSQFLEEFFRQIMPECEKDAMEYLNTLVDRMYLDRNITPETDLSKLTPEDYPIFDDLYDEILQEFQSTNNPFTRDLLRTLMNYVAKFSEGGRNANIWNGPSTVTTDENFTVFNFQSMLANRNTAIANAQMLLVLKYIDNEIIKNRDYNLKYRANRKIVVVIDEAHVFIDAKFPIALDFMFQLAKRIRKYNGMQIVITQNIKDFVGSEELARKSTAIINACQYSFIFSLAPNDIQDLVKLYENAGGINESEQEQIVQAPRGQVFTIMSPRSRSTFQVDTAPGIVDIFQERNYRSRYFVDAEDEARWDRFLADSRPLHDEAAAARRGRSLDAPEEEPEETAAPLRAVLFEEMNWEDVEQSGPSAGNVLEEITEPEPVSTSEHETAPAVIGVLDRITDTLERISAGLPAAPPRAEGELDERLREKDAEIERLCAELERRDAVETPASEPDEEDVFDLAAFSKPAMEQAPEPAEIPDPDAPLDEADGGLSELPDEEPEDNDWMDIDFSQEREDEEAEDETEDESGDAESEESTALPAPGGVMSMLLSSLNNFRSKSVFERMRMTGEVREEITLDDLIGATEDERERRRSGKEKVG